MSSFACFKPPTKNPFGELYAPNGRKHHAWVRINAEKFCMFGGEDDTGGNDSFLNDLHSFSVELNVWNKIGKCVGPRLSRHSMICRDLVDKRQRFYDFNVFGKELVVFGGIRAFQSRSNDVHVYNFDDQNWRKVQTVLADCPEKFKSIQMPPPVYSHTAAYIKSKNKMLVFGGSIELPPNLQKSGIKSTYSKYLHYLSFDDDQYIWSFEKPKIDEFMIPRAEHTGVLMKNDSMYIVFGGVTSAKENMNKYLNDCWMLNLDGKSQWTELECTGDKPAPRFGHAAASHGNYMFVFGGGLPLQRGLYRLNIDSLVWENIHIPVLEKGIRLPLVYGHSMMNWKKENGHPQLLIFGGSRYMVSTEEYMQASDEYFCVKNEDTVKEIKMREFGKIDDEFNSLPEISNALVDAGLKTCHLVCGIDCTFSNHFQGERTFNKFCLHHLFDDERRNPYEEVIDILGKTLEQFDEDGQIPCFGFGDIQTKDKAVFAFLPDPKDPKKHCSTFQEVLEIYRKIIPTIQFSGPTSFAPLIRHCINIVKVTMQYHILIIIADGQVSHDGETIDAIVEASYYPLSLICIGVGDGNFDMMKHYDDDLDNYNRQFDNFQFLWYDEVIEESRKHFEAAKEKNPEIDLKSYLQSQFALNALMEIPAQYTYCKMKFGLEEV